MSSLLTALVKNNSNLGPLLVSAIVCGCSSSGSTGAASPEGSSGGAADAGDVAAGSMLPGDPQQANTPTSGIVDVVINGQRRTFSGDATWRQLELPSDENRAALNGFFTNTQAANDWAFSLWVHDGTLGTHTCQSEGVLMGITNEILADGGVRADPTTWGNSQNGDTCTVTLTAFGSHKGDHVTGTFTAELDEKRGISPVRHLSLTNGRFDLVLVNSADVP